MQNNRNIYVRVAELEIPLSELMKNVNHSLVGKVGDEVVDQQKAILFLTNFNQNLPFDNLIYSVYGFFSRRGNVLDEKVTFARGKRSLRSSSFDISGFQPNPAEERQFSELEEEFINGILTFEGFFPQKSIDQHLRITETEMVRIPGPPYTTNLTSYNFEDYLFDKRVIFHELAKKRAQMSIYRTKELKVE